MPVITAQVNTKIFHFVNPWYLVTIQHYLATMILTFKGIKLYIPFCTIYITNTSKRLQTIAGSLQQRKSSAYMTQPINREPTCTP